MPRLHIAPSRHKGACDFDAQYCMTMMQYMGQTQLVYWHQLAPCTAPPGTPSRSKIVLLLTGFGAVENKGLLSCRVQELAVWRSGSRHGRACFCGTINTLCP